MIIQWNAWTSTNLVTIWHTVTHPHHLLIKRRPTTETKRLTWDCALKIPLVDPPCRIQMHAHRWWFKILLTTWDAHFFVHNGLKYQPQLVIDGLLNHQQHYWFCDNHTNVVVSWSLTKAHCRIPTATVWTVCTTTASHPKRWCGSTSNHLWMVNLFSRIWWKHTQI